MGVCIGQIATWCQPRTWGVSPAALKITLECQVFILPLEKLWGIFQGVSKNTGNPEFSHHFAFLAALMTMKKMDFGEGQHATPCFRPHKSCYPSLSPDFFLGEVGGLTGRVAARSQVEPWAQIKNSGCAPPLEFGFWMGRTFSRSPLRWRQIKIQSYQGLGKFCPWQCLNKRCFPSWGPPGNQGGLWQPRGPVEDLLATKGAPPLTW